MVNRKEMSSSQVGEIFEKSKGVLTTFGNLKVRSVGVKPEKTSKPVITFEFDRAGRVIQAFTNFQVFVPEHLGARIIWMEKTGCEDSLWGV